MSDQDLPEITDDIPEQELEAEASLLGAAS